MEARYNYLCTLVGSPNHQHPNNVDILNEATSRLSEAKQILNAVSRKGGDSPHVIFNASSQQILFASFLLERTESLLNLKDKEGHVYNHKFCNLTAGLTHHRLISRYLIKILMLLKGEIRGYSYEYTLPPIGDYFHLRTRLALDNFKNKILPRVLYCVRKSFRDR